MVGNDGEGFVLQESARHDDWSGSDDLDGDGTVTFNGDCLSDHFGGPVGGSQSGGIDNGRGGGTSEIPNRQVSMACQSCLCIKSLTLRRLWCC